MIGRSDKSIDIYVGMSPESQAEFANSSIIPVQVTKEMAGDGDLNSTGDSKSIIDILGIGKELEEPERLRVFVVPMTSDDRDLMQNEMMYILKEVIPDAELALLDAEKAEDEIVNELPAA
tara:strand:- start:162 stop:521 length:360 start_codon:yes stop_codon:yes gene_type:complete